MSLDRMPAAAMRSLAALLCVSQFASAFASTPSPGKVAAAPRQAIGAPAPAGVAVALPVIEDAAVAWQAYLRDATAESSNEAYGVLPAMFADTGEPAKNCRERLPALDRSISVAPVGLALWHAGYRCAQSLADDALAARYGESFGKLAAYALKQESDRPWAAPIRVLNINDIYSLVIAADLEVRYSYIETSRLPTYYVIQLAVSEPESKQERHLNFDFLDTLYRLKSSDELAGYPGQRSGLRDGFREQQVKSGEAMGLDLQAVSDASDLSTAREKVAVLRGPAASGGLNSIRTWLATCSRTPYPGCADGLVDAILPAAEQQLASYTVELAVAYSLGVGVGKDPNAAMTLLDSADKTWSHGHAVAEYAEQMFAASDQPLSVAAHARLLAAEQQGSERAAAIRLFHLVHQNKAKTFPPAVLAAMLKLANAGHPRTQLLAATYYDALGQGELASRWWQKGAESGEPAAMDAYAERLMAGSRGVAKSRALGMEWKRKSAHAGNAEAMRYMAAYESSRGRWAEAEKWLKSGVGYGDYDAAIELAAVYSKPHPDVAADSGRALKLYEALDKALDTSQVRREFADLLINDRAVRDPARARALLLKDAEKGDGLSQYRLGIAMLEGRLPGSDSDEGLRWVGKALTYDKGQIAADFAHWLYYKQGTSEARKRALAMTRKLAGQGLLMAQNNMAWWLCTSDDPGLRAAQEGLATAKRMGDAESLGGGAVDSVAACYAAVGQFDRAAELQRLAIAKIEDSPSQSSDGEALKARLALYVGKQPYIEAASVPKPVPAVESERVP
jgi:TPR repeat protein